jgi:hypothetical protein
MQQYNPVVSSVSHRRVQKTMKYRFHRFFRHIILSCWAQHSTGGVGNHHCMVLWQLPHHDHGAKWVCSPYLRIQTLECLHGEQTGNLWLLVVFYHAQFPTCLSNSVLQESPPWRQVICGCYHMPPLLVPWIILLWELSRREKVRCALSRSSFFTAN